VSGDVPVLAYYRGDDGYLIDRAVAAVGERLERGTGMRPERWRAAGAETNAAAITERVATAPMFGGGTLAVVEDPAPLLRSKDAREALEGAIRSVAPGNALVFVEQGDAGNRRSAAVQGLEASVQRAGGEARLFKAPTADALAGWITARSTERGLRLGPGAAKELARRVGGFVREGDVDRQRQGALAVAELAKLALYRPDGAIAQEDVQALVPEVVPDSTWAFLDAVAERRAGTAARLLDHLLESTPEPVILVQLHRRLRELLEVADQLASGVAPAALVRALKMNPYRVEILARQARAWTSADLEDALEGVLELDAMVKGAPDAFGTDSQRRLAFALWVQERVASSAAGSVAAPRRG
jgi:DNA polymerase III delta subunit